MLNLPEIISELDVQFYDVDSMDVVWHGHYVKYLERARCALLNHISYNYIEMKQSGYAWPVIKLSLRYARPAQFGQVLQIITRMSEWEYRLVMDYDIVDKESGVKLTSASSTQVAVEIASGETCMGSPLILEQSLRKAGYLCDHV